MTLYRLTVAVLSLLFLTGCVSLAPSAKPTPAWTVKLTDAPLLSSGYTKGFRASFQFGPWLVPNPIFLGAKYDDAHGLVRPRIIMKLGDQWRIAALPELEHEDFIYAGVCFARHEIFAILDWAVEDPGWDLDIIHSTDGGATWSPLASVQKPTYLAGLSSFTMDASGRGCLTLSYLETDSGPAARGYYRYTTTNGGKTWSAPKFQRDDLLDAQHIYPDDTIKFDGASPLSSAQLTRFETDYRFNPPDVPDPIFLGGISDVDADDDSPMPFHPTIITKCAGQWHIATMPKLKNEGFLYAGYCPARHEFFAILEWSVEDPSGVLDIIHSTDGGATWSILASVTMPSNGSDFSSFSMEASGHGRLTVRHDDNADALSVPIGYYHYTTTNGGKTWSAPKFEKDDIQDADDVRSSETAFRDAIKTANSDKGP